ncbi:DUF4012 domain-containing protein [Microbacterium sp. OR16]|uniref:DUF4012 domain-containing protein n=1 Tax=Microbacterium sp. OR16 TaxID=3095345 RepID=UPI0039B46612
MSDNSAPRTGRRPRRPVIWAAVVVAAILLLAAAWVLARGAVAAGELQKLEKTASGLRAAVASGDLDRAARDARTLSEHARSARDLTGDPIWRAFEIVPWAGSNLTAVREASQIAADIADGALPPLLTAAKSIDPARFTITEGRIDLALFAEAQEPLAQATDVLTAAAAHADRIDGEVTIPPIAEAVDQLRAVVHESLDIVEAAHSSAVLIPPMLGIDAPRTYVVAMLNNAELRSAGGIAGAFALVRAEHGALSIVGQASTSDFPPLETPLQLSPATVALFDDRPGRHIQNLPSIPDFGEAAPAMASRWQERFGDQIDGVIAIDAVVARHLLAATGPQTVGPFTIDADNVLTVLLSEVYRRYSDPREQDAVFAQTAAVLFDAAVHADDPAALVKALGASVTEGRIRIWSAHDSEERILAASAVGGGIPSDSPEAPVVGVLLNDTSGSKMDVYAHAAISTRAGVCDGVPTTRVEVTWSNEVPADIVPTLPPYVSAYGWFGVTPGDTRTLIAVYGPAGAAVARYDRDGAQEPVQTAQLDGRVVVQHSVTLSPGASSTITVDFIGEGAGEAGTVVQHTPMATDVEVSAAPLRCGS